MSSRLLPKGRTFIAIIASVSIVLLIMATYFFYSLSEIRKISPQPYVTIVNNNISAKAKLLLLKAEILNFSIQQDPRSLARLKMQARVHKASILQDLKAQRTRNIHAQYGDLDELAELEKRISRLATQISDLTLKNEEELADSLSAVEKTYFDLNKYLSSFVAEVQRNQLEFTQDKENLYDRQYLYMVVIIACSIILVGVISYMYLHQIKLSQDLTERGDKLEEAKKLAEQHATAKARFLANMSHEMRTPLNAIIGLSHKEYYEATDEQTRNFLSMINSSGQHLLKLINSVLDLSKIEQGKMKLQTEAFYCSELIELSKTIFVDMSKIDVEIFFSTELNKDYKLIADKTKLLQLINNLSYNALKFTEQGYVDVRLSLERSEPESFLRLKVSDTGIGMSREQLDKVFEEFTQADDSITRKYGGTGLGLSICQSLVNLMSGRIEVKSELNKGTEFSVVIPVQVEGEKTIGCAMNLERRIRVVSADLHAKELISDELKRFDLFDKSGDIAVYYHSGENRVEDNFPEVHSEEQMSVVIADLHASVPLSEKQVKLTKPYDIFSLLSALGNHNRNLDQSEVSLNRSSGLSALIVEDMRVNQIVAQKMLRTLQVETTTANNGQECLDIIKQRHFDIIFMDIQMPIMDGIEALKRIRQDDLAPDTAIVALTANTFDKDVLHYLELGFNDVVPKPVRMELVQRILDKYSPATI
ncbi:ATP-binding protein [Vibrio tubiashii]|uniref:histidine kinase n=1 Tax=Vibrio tubiashii ATCC 19109 TaxID=1051646 RepID=F9T3I8_9VIBR|nr:ATP-binding protein [Vibrio tubiashii]AIW15696.1 histidine kinase [Vibrio tubiashii ATCC 19109]EGU56918.1 signal transduction histidine kinase [Vibrio tubiashii ATCC 19109]EIF02670.1 signal transduction histidine kinase [Vibrio tubiashii NCIMB 1337 = ATCC 19106]